MTVSAVRRRTTLRDVADAAGVHVSTVSRALNPDTRHFMRPEVARRILQASAALNYRPNAAAYSLRTRRTRTVGVLIPDIANPVFLPIIRGIEEVLGAHGYVAILVNTDARPGRQANHIEMLTARGIDGLLVASLQRRDAAVREIVESGLPMVAVNREVEECSVASVINDEDRGLRLILEHLFRLGHRRVATIAGPQNLSTGFARYRAFQRHRASLGLEPIDALECFAEGCNEVEGERGAELLLNTGIAHSAIVACNDRLAIGAISALKRRGLACPMEVSVTGFNDMPLVDRFEPSLTTVRVQQYELGRRAAALLVERIEHSAPVAGGSVVMPVELVVRSSTAPAPSDHRSSWSREN